MSKATLKDTRKWLLMLLARMPITMSVDETEAKVRMITPAMATHYPAEVFTEVSLDYVAAELEFFRESDIRGLLDIWRRSNAPDTTGGLPVEAANAPLDDDGKHWAAMWFRHQQNDQEAASTLGLISSTHKAAYHWLLRTDVTAAAIAVRLGWEGPGAFNIGRLEAEWGNPDVIRRAIRSCMGDHLDGTFSNPNPTQIAQALSFLESLVQRYAPQNLPLLPHVSELTAGS